MKWQILIVSQYTRRAFLDQVVAQLERQIAALGLRRFEDVDVMIHVDNPGQLLGRAAGIGEMREHLRHRSTGEYINFIDDDDLIAPDYVSSILPLLDGVDQVGFEVKCFTDRRLVGMASHSLQHKKWCQSNGRIGEDQMKFCRDISHLNPMRRELAMQAVMAGGVGEDCRWANDMRVKGIVKTEHFIPKALYWYLWRGQKNDLKDANDPWRLGILGNLTPQPTS